MNFKPLQFYKKAQPVKVAEPFTVFFKDEGKLSEIRADGYLNIEDAISATREFIGGHARGFLVLLKGGKSDK